AFPTPASTTESTSNNPDADPDDSLGAPPSYLGTRSRSTSRTRSPNSSMSRPGSFYSNVNTLSRVPEQQRRDHQDGSDDFYNNTPSTPLFNIVTPKQQDSFARWWKLLHLLLAFILGAGVIYREYKLQGGLGRFENLAVEPPSPNGGYQVSQIVSSYLYIYI